MRLNENLLKRINLLPRAQAVSAGDSVFTEEHRQLIAEAYKTLLGKDIPNCVCRHRYTDVLVEICVTLKIKNTMKCKYKLLSGVIIWIGTECYNNRNLTDEVAEEYLRMHPEAREKEFQEWPEDSEPEPEKTDPEPSVGEGDGENGDPNPDESEGEDRQKEEKTLKKPKGKKGK